MDYSILMWLLKAFLVFVFALFALAAIGAALIISDTKPDLGELIVEITLASFVIILLLAFGYILMISAALLGDLQ